MPWSRSASNPISFHSWTGQYYVTRGGKRIYLGSLLDVLSEPDALEMMRSLIPELVARLPGQFVELVNRLGRLPLALKVAAGLLQAESGYGWGVDSLLSDLTADCAGLLVAEAPADMLYACESTTPNVAALLRRSTDRLDPRTRELFGYLGAFAPSPAMFDMRDLAAVWKLEDPKPTIRTLVARGLLEAAGHGQFYIHALLVAHAQSLWSSRGS